MSYDYGQMSTILTALYQTDEQIKCVWEGLHIMFYLITTRRGHVLGLDLFVWLTSWEKKKRDLQVY